jgi:hypothetical protein
MGHHDRPFHFKLTNLFSPFSLPDSSDVFLTPLDPRILSPLSCQILSPLSCHLLEDPRSSLDPLTSFFFHYYCLSTYHFIILLLFLYDVGIT